MTSRSKTARSALLPVVLSALLAGCASYPVNPELASYDPDSGYRFDQFGCPGGGEACNETLIVLALSGGGTRAAAFSYGVMQALAGHAVGPQRSLLDEVDIVSSVSGGSFAASYFKLYGKTRFLDEFEEQVLQRKMQNAILARLLAPWNWFKLMSPNYARSDLADAYYDKYIFNGARFGDLRRERPFMVLNATDLTIGARFSFVQDHFDRLCSDIGEVTVSRGVTASSAFPVVFTPLTVRNWNYPAPTCGYDTPEWVQNALQNDLELNPARYDRALAWQSYANPERRFVHLSDGGIADNIGMRSPMEGLLSPTSPIPLVELLNRVDDADNYAVRRVVFIIVDAKPGRNLSDDRSARPPGILSVLNAAASNPMENYSADTVELARRWVEQFETQFIDADEEPPQTFYRINLRFEAERDPATRERLQKIPTRLQLPDEDLRLLIDAGARLLCQSPDFQRLLTDLDGVALATACAGEAPVTN